MSNTTADNDNEPDILDLVPWIAEVEPKLHAATRYLPFDRLYPILRRIWYERGSPEIREGAMKFKICEAGSNVPVLGLENLPSNHAQMLMLVPVGTKGPSELAVGESCLCRASSSSVPNAKPTKEQKNVFTVVRTE